MNGSEEIFNLIKHLVETNKDDLFLNEHQVQAYHTFLSLGLPTNKHEQWRSFPLEKMFDKEYTFKLQAPHVTGDPSSLFSCQVLHFETYLFSTLNGEYVYNHSPLVTFENGMIAGSLFEAIKLYPNLINPYIYQIASNLHSSFVALNSSLARSGFFLYIPKGIHVDKPIQLINLINTDIPSWINIRNVIVVDEGAEVEFVQCDDSVHDKNNLVNIVNEIYLHRDAQMKFVKLQNKDLETSLVTSTFVHQDKKASIDYVLVTLNSGVIRNDLVIELNGEGARAELDGLYLVDKTQVVDNHVYVHHNVPACYSRQNFRGILDDEALAIFRGHVKVARGAQQTDAYQSNKNILLTPTTRVFSEPFLEIYADDVKCSHGSSTGRLDEEAIFYLKQRGICERDARLLLMYAFAQNILEHIEPLTLKKSLDEMVDKRLKGELHPCALCVLHCESKPLEFKIKI